MVNFVLCRVLRDVIPPTPPGPEGSNGNGLVWAQWVARYTFTPYIGSDLLAVPQWRSGFSPLHSNLHLDPLAASTMA